MLSIHEFDYVLPEEKIAISPHVPRDHSKLLKFRRGQISDHSFYELPNLIPENSFLVFNESKVIRARILFETEERKTIEIFCLEPAFGLPVQQGLEAKNKVCWNVLIGGKKKMKNDVLQLNLLVGHDSVQLNAKRIEDYSSYSVVEFSWEKNVCFSALLEQCGKIPLPPYLNRDETTTDFFDYQTTYAQVMGSVAAPTAGLHFTDNTFRDLQNRRIAIGKIVLHVGAGTFKPVKDEDVSKHLMHEEEILVSDEFLASLLLHSGSVGAIGTTSLRTLESIYWLSEKIKSGETERVEIKQWDDKRFPGTSSRIENIKFLLDFMQENKIQNLRFKSSLMICPPYRFRMIDFLITNFHQPKSTLLLLIAALVGEDWKTIYSHALKSGYRFLSFGDSSVLFTN